MFSIIVAMDKNRLIGSENKLPWRLKGDMGSFKTLTMDKTIVMGRKTFESLNSKPLPGRLNIVMTRQSERLTNGIIQTADKQLIVDMAKDQEIMVIGGTEIYHEFLPLTKRIYQTVVDGEYEGDAYFPLIQEEKWTHASNWEREENGITYRTQLLVRA